MKRTHIFALSALLLYATVPSALAGAQGAQTTAHVARAAKVGLRHTRVGAILVSSSGRTLYEFTRDRPHSNVCVKIKECPAIWPALQSSGKPLAGPGVRSSLLSTIKLPGGSSQVTYAGHPLYLYSGDTGPGQTSYVGETAFGGRWYAIDASGRTVK